MTLSAPGTTLQPLFVPVNKNPKKEDILENCSIWENYNLRGIDQGIEASEWLAKLFAFLKLSLPLEGLALVKWDDSFRREANPEFTPNHLKTKCILGFSGKCTL